MYARHPDVIVRREYFGGIAFHRGTGATIELDREACLFLERADGRSIRAIAEGICGEGYIQDIYAVADTLLREGFLAKDAKNSAIKATGWPEKVYLSAPETVHLATTHRCNGSARGAMSIP